MILLSWPPNPQIWISGTLGFANVFFCLFFPGSEISDKLHCAFVKQLQDGCVAVSVGWNIDGVNTPSRTFCTKILDFQSIYSFLEGTGCLLLSMVDLVDEASRFHLGRQRQHSAVICSGALLFSSRVLCPSLVTLCSHKSGRCAVELYHASHLWYPPFYTSPVASRALQHWTASPTKDGCHWQAGGENRQTWQLANAAWYT